MVQISLTIPNEHVQRIIDAMDFYFPKEEGDTRSDQDRYKSLLYAYTRSFVLNFENRNVQDEANQSKEEELNNDIPDV